MTYTGMVLSEAGVFPPEALLFDYAAAAMARIGVTDIKSVKACELLQATGKENDNSSGAFFVVPELSAADWGAMPDGYFCARENTLFVNGRGETLGALIFSPVSEPEAIQNRVTVDGERITPENFSRVMKARRAAVKAAFPEAFFEDECPAVSPLARIGKSYIGAGAVIAGKSVIGDGCSVTGASLIADSRIGDGTQIRSAVILQSEVGKSVSVGPFAYVRPGSRIGDRVKVGDFVEIKNSVVGDGTKISHLTYVGDSDVGGGVNFGCGTVTVNYDGVHKHRTVIGDNAFIGCNANLVAPVTVGENAFIAAGSTVTDDVPPRSFAVARQRQTTKLGYVEEKMPDLIK